MKRIRIFSAREPSVQATIQPAKPAHTPPAVEQPATATHSGPLLRPEQNKILAIQQQSGNHSAQRYLKTKAHGPNGTHRTAGNAGPLSTVHASIVQRDGNLFGGGSSLDMLTTWTPETIQEAIDARRGSELVKVRNYSIASVAQREQIADIFMGQWSDLSNVNRAAQLLWNSFGDDLLSLSPQFGKLFKAHVKLGMETTMISAIQRVQALLEQDIRAIAKMYSAKNFKYIENELREITPGYAGPEGDPYAAQRPKQRIEMIQEYAHEVRDAQMQQKALKLIPVGYRWHNPATPKGEPYISDVTFDPEQKPQFESMSGSYQSYPPKDQSWDKVNQQYQAQERNIAEVSSKSPAVYRAKVEQRLDDLIDNPPVEANQEAADLLAKTLVDVANVQGRLDDIDVLDMLPIISQLTNGKVDGPSGTRWASPFNAAAAEAIVGQHKLEDLVKSLGVALAGAVAFALAEVATGGFATVALLGAGGISSGYQVYDSATKAMNMSAVADSAVSDETRAVTQEQADDAVFSAWLDTAGLLLDVYGGVATLRKLSSATHIGTAADEAVELTASRIGMLDSLTPDLRVNAVRQAVNEFGVEEATSLARLDHPEELLEYVYQDPELVDRIRAFSTKLDEAAPTGKEFAGEVLAELGNVRKGLSTDPATVEAVLLNGIETMGAAKALREAGGWHKIKGILPPESEAGKRLFEWRDQIYQDLQAFIGLDDGDVIRTGTYNNFKNDLDISAMGKGSSANQQKALAYLEKRTGIPREEFEDQLLISVFTDPNRSHIYDTLDESDRLEVAIHAGITERELMLNKMLLDAEKEGPEAVARIRDRFEALGVRPSSTFRVLSKEERLKTGLIVDALEREFEATTDVAKKRDLAKQISDYQAQINLAEGGGYATGGAVAETVSKKEGIGRGPGGSTKVLLAPQQLMNITGQFTKIESAVKRLANAQTLQEAVAAFREVTKLANRYIDGRPLILAEHLKEADKLTDALQHLSASLNLKNIEKTLAAGDIEAKIGDVLNQTQTLFDWMDADMLKALTAFNREAGFAGMVVDPNMMMNAIDAQLRAFQYKGDAVKTLMQVIGLSMDAKGAQIGYESGRDQMSYGY